MTMKTTLWTLQSLTSRSSTLRSSCRACYFSSSPAATSTAAASKEDTDEPSAPPSQPFVQARLRPGEWDPESHTNNPLYRPAYKSRAKIVSAQDFANRPRVGLSGEFESLTDAMVTLSWLSSTDQASIYQWYLNLMQYSQQKHGVTSHEYICRVIAQKFHVTPERVAATIQLQHNEQQLKNAGTKLLDEAADYMDQAIVQEIQEAYKTFGLRKPAEEPFVEDPVGVSGLQESKSYQTVADLFDVDQLTSDAVARDEAKARLALDGHVYIEDKDDESIDIPLHPDCHKLLQKQKEWSRTRQEPVVEGPSTQADGTKRPRWKFVAQAVNTRQLRKDKRAVAKSYVNNHAADTLVEVDGELRPGNMADVKQVAWKPVRHVQEHTYGGAKKAWLDRMVRGESGNWGMATAAPAAVKEEVAAKQEDSTEEDEIVAAADDSSSSDDEENGDGALSSDSEGSSSDESGSEEEEESEDATTPPEKDGSIEKKKKD